MPESRNRHKHHHPHHASHPALHQPRVKRKRSAASVLALLAAMLGLAVAFFSQGTDAAWMITGAVSGALIGYVVGRNMDKAIENK